MYVVQKGNTGLIKKTVVDHDVFHAFYDSLGSLEQSTLSVYGMTFKYSQRKGTNIQFIQETENEKDNKKKLTLVIQASVYGIVFQMGEPLASCQETYESLFS